MHINYMKLFTIWKVQNPINIYIHSNKLRHSNTNNQVYNLLHFKNDLIEFNVGSIIIFFFFTYSLVGYLLIIFLYKFYFRAYYSWIIIPAYLLFLLSIHLNLIFSDWSLNFYSTKLSYNKNNKFKLCLH